MNPIISSLSNRPSNDFHQKKTLLNEEFYSKSKIQGLVSYIYYPAQRSYPFKGHAELEIEGISYTLMLGEFKARSLTQMIKSSETGNGFPFFRFPISVSPNQLQCLKKNKIRTRIPICSMGVAKALSRQVKYSIPLPFTFSPLASAMYLTSAKMLGSQRVKQIEFHKGTNPLINVAKSITGLLVEGYLLGSVIIIALAVSLNSLKYLR